MSFIFVFISETQSLFEILAANLAAVEARLKSCDEQMDKIKEISEKK